MCHQRLEHKSQSYLQSCALPTLLTHNIPQCMLPFVGGALTSTGGLVVYTQSHYDSQLSLLGYIEKRDGELKRKRKGMANIY